MSTLSVKRLAMERLVMTLCATTSTMCGSADAVDQIGRLPDDLREIHIAEGTTADSLESHVTEQRRNGSYRGST